LLYAGKMEIKGPFGSMKRRGRRKSGLWGPIFIQFPISPNCFVWLEGIARRARIIWIPKSHVNSANMQLPIPSKSRGLSWNWKKRRKFKV